jgi:hypothetical protein
VPQIDLEDIEIEKLVQRVMESLTRLPQLTEHERKAASKRKYFAEWARGNPADAIRLVKDQWPLLFGYEFVERGDFRRYILEELTRDEANAALRFYITDPESVYKIWFESYKWENPVSDRRDNIADKLTQMLQTLKTQLDESANLNSTIRGALDGKVDGALSAEDREKLKNLKMEVQEFRSEMASPEELSKHPAWIKIVGKEGAIIAAQIFYALYREKREIKRSDAIDMIHAMYLPHTDLWRGDKAFSNLLIKNKVHLHERVVPSLAELPNRIREEIANKEGGRDATALAETVKPQPNGKAGYDVL